MTDTRYAELDVDTGALVRRITEQRLTHTGRRDHTVLVSPKRSRRTGPHCYVR